MKRRALNNYLIMFNALLAVGCTRPVDVSTTTASSTTVGTTIAASNPSYEILAKDGYAYPDILRTTCEDLTAQVARGTDLIIVDTRDESKFNEGHLAGAINIPYAVVVSGAEEATRRLTALPDDKLEVFYCD